MAHPQSPQRISPRLWTAMLLLSTAVDALVVAETTGSTNSGFNPSKQAGVPKSLLTGLPFEAHNASSFLLYPELAKLYHSIASDPALLASALECSEYTGIPELASRLSDTVFGAVAAFKTYGFCSLTTAEEQVERMNYMLSYGLSLHMRTAFESDYDCQGVEGLPLACFLAAPLQAALRHSALQYSGSLLCSEVESDGKTQVQQYVLPELWQVKKPSVSCIPRMLHR